jgi:Protein of unknown function (DUF2877)
MPITRISSQVLQVVDGRRYLRIHSVFESAVNLQAGHRLVNCSAGVISLPYGIEMTPADLGRLQRTCRSTPDEPMEWRSQDHTLISRIGNVAIIATPRTAVFEPALPAASGNSLSAAVTELIARLARMRASTGLCDDWLALTKASELTDAVDSLHDGAADRRVLHWLGRGPGLTPSGDDLLVGMVAALWFISAVDSPKLAPFRKLFESTEGRLTTDISVEHLHYACRGMFTGGVIDLLIALDQANEVAALDALARLGRYGHTSGMDCTLGVVTALRHVLRIESAQHH